MKRQRGKEAEEADGLRNIQDVSSKPGTSTNAGISDFVSESLSSPSIDPAHQTGSCAKRNWRILGQKLRKVAAKVDDPLVSPLNLWSITTLSSTSHNLYRLSYRDFSVTIPVPDLRCSISDLTGFDNTGNMKLWPGGEALAAFLYDQPALVIGKKVLELGAGLLGLPSIVASSHALSVYVSDGNERSIRSLTSIAKIVPISPVLLQWGVQNLNCHFDLIIAADCIFFENTHSSFIDCLKTHTEKDSIVLICSPERGNDSLTMFLNKDLLQSLHFAVMKTSDDVSERMKSSGTVGMSFDTDVINRMTSLVWDTCMDWSKDMLTFSAHAGRASVNSEDVSLIMRRNPELNQHVRDLAGITESKDKARCLKRGKPAGTNVKKPKPTTSSAFHPVDHNVPSESSSSTSPKAIPKAALPSVAPAPQKKLVEELAPPPICSPPPCRSRYQIDEFDDADEDFPPNPALTAVTPSTRHARPLATSTPYPNPRCSQEPRTSNTGPGVTPILENRNVQHFVPTPEIHMMTIPEVEESRLEEIPGPPLSSTGVLARSKSSRKLYDDDPVPVKEPVGNRMQKKNSITKRSDSKDSFDDDDDIICQEPPLIIGSKVPKSIADPSKSYPQPTASSEPEVITVDDDSFDIDQPGPSTSADKAKNPSIEQSMQKEDSFDSFDMFDEHEEQTPDPMHDETGKFATRNTVPTTSNRPPGPTKSPEMQEFDGFSLFSPMKNPEKQQTSGLQSSYGLTKFPKTNAQGSVKVNQSKSSSSAVVGIAGTSTDALSINPPKPKRARSSEKENIIGRPKEDSPDSFDEEPWIPGDKPKLHSKSRTGTPQLGQNKVTKNPSTSSISSGKGGGPTPKTSRGGSKSATPSTPTSRLFANRSRVANAFRAHIESDDDFDID